MTGCPALKVRQRTVELAADLHLENAECPVWNPMDGRLYFADIPRGKMFRLDPESMAVELVHEAGEQIGALLVAEDGSVMQGLEGGRVQAWKDGQVKAIVDRIPEEKGRRFNDGIVDPRGRMLLGTMPDKNGQALVYSVNADGNYRVLLNGIGQANGIDFSLDGKTLYVTDTKARQILALRYDPESGAVAERRIQIDLGDKGPVPDGLEVDSEGRIWSAQWGGGCCICFSPEGGEMFRKTLPTAKVSSVAFGGPALEFIFFTTAGGDDPSKRGELAGGVFWERANVPGRVGSLARVS